jgi:Fic family protein
MTDQILSSLLASLSQKKQQLDQLRPLPAVLSDNLQDWLRIELTYHSNAIEGNTLSRAETTLAVEKNLTTAGKTIREHLEAINHAQAFDWIVQASQDDREKPITKKTVLRLHQLVLQKIDEANAGRFRHTAIRIAGSSVILPNAAKVPELMDQFETWLQTQAKEVEAQASANHPALTAAQAHYKLVSIHPFADGNGRTARLLMNLLLLRADYPPAIIRNQDRQQYFTSLEKAQLGDSPEDYYRLIYQAIDRSLDLYLQAATESDQELDAGLSAELDSEKKIVDLNLDQNQDEVKKEAVKGKQATQKLLKIGELADLADETVATIRHWTNKDLLPVSDRTPGGYQLYAPDCVAKCKQIRRLQKEQRLTLEEIAASRVIEKIKGHFP